MNARPKQVDAVLREQNYDAGLVYSDLLDLVDFDDESNLFLTVDGRFGRQWYLGHLQGETLDEDARLQISEALASAVDRYPETSIGQLLRFTHTDIRDDLMYYLKPVKADTWGADIARSIAQIHIRGANQGYLAKVAGTAMKAAQAQAAAELAEEKRSVPMQEIERHTHTGEFALKNELYLNVSFLPRWHGEGLFVPLASRLRVAFGLRTLQDIYKQKYDEVLDAFITACDKIEQQLISSGFMLSRVTGQGMVNLLYRMLNPERSRGTAPPTYDSRYPLYTQLLGRVGGLNFNENGDRLSDFVCQSKLHTTARGWVVDGWHYRVTSALSYPEATRPALIQDAVDSDSGEGWACINFMVPTQAPARFMLKARRSAISARGNLMPPNSMLAPDPVKMAKRTDDIQLLINATNPEERDHQKIVQTSVHCVVRDRDPNRAEERSKRFRGGLWNSGYSEELRGDAVIHSTLPFNLRKQGITLLARTAPMLSRNMTDLAPLYSAFSGLSDGRLLYANAEGTPIFVDLFTTHAHAPHTLIVGGTGTGKSFTCNNILAQSIAQRDSIVFGIDKGNSYESLCKTMSGEYVRLNLSGLVDGKRLCLNPLYVPDTPEGEPVAVTATQVDYMVGTLKAMIKSGTQNESGQTEAVPKEDQNLLEKALYACHETRMRDPAHPEVVMSTLYDYMDQQDDPRYKSLALKIRNYTVAGAYGALFDGPLTISWDNSFIVFELGDIASSPAADVLMLMLFTQIDTVCKRKDLLSKKKYVFVDEAWFTLAKPHLAGSLGGFARELRKYGGCLILLSQSLNDFAKVVKAEGQTDDGIFANTRHFIFLSCTTADVTVARELLSLTEGDIRLWGTTVSIRPYFQEFFYLMRATSGQLVPGKVRLYSSALVYWMSSTSPSEITARDERVNKLITAGTQREEAVRLACRQLAEEYPYGIAYAPKTI